MSDDTGHTDDPDGGTGASGNRKHPAADNVIYANFGARTRVDHPAEIPQRPVPAQLSPAAMRLTVAATSRADQGRVTRGRQYAQAGNVIDLSIRTGAAHGRVAGSQNEPFTVTVILPYRANDDLSQIPELLARTPNGMTRARRGQFGDDVLDLIFGEDPADIRFGCDCPDPQLVCKHVIAVVDRLAAKVDADPSLVFQFRGMTLDSVEASVLEQARSVSEEATQDGSELFWSGRELPDHPEPKVAPALEDSDLDLLHKAMRSVSFTNIDQLRAVSDIEDLYDHLTR